MSRHLAFAAVAIALLACASTTNNRPTATAQEAEPDPVQRSAVVNFDRLFVESQTGKALLQEFDQWQRAGQDELERGQDEINAVRRDLAARMASMSEEEAMAGQARLERLTLSLRRKQEDLAREGTQKHNALLEELYGKWGQAVGEVAKEEGYAMVFNWSDAGLVFVSEELDITPQVIARVDGR